MRISKLSPKQRLAMNWWNNEQYRSYDAVICDGAVRSGKTLALSLGFVLWAAASFDKAAFAMCGKTVTALRRNVIAPLMPLLRDMGIQCSEKVSRSYFDVSLAGRSNRFYLFGGRDEGSAALIQGMTLSGVFFDEVVLMPRSFVEQALARCSVSGSRMWFCCNTSISKNITGLNFKFYFSIIIMSVFRSINYTYKILLNVMTYNT